MTNKYDPITFEVIKNALDSIAEEMEADAEAIKAVLLGGGKRYPDAVESHTWGPLSNEPRTKQH